MRIWRPSRIALRRLGWAAAALLVLAALPVLWIETRCTAKPTQQPLTRDSLLAKQDWRDEINSYLTYPEWSIVHAYEDLAAVTRQRSESSYDYLGAITRYWTSLCSIYELASARGTISPDYRVMLHVIGLSFAGEMGVKGLYEKTIGRLSVLIRGSTRTPEDEFALRLADEYAAFLRQTPWYEFPFGARLAQFWRETPLWGGNVVRKLERRIALTLEWGSKAVYARLIGAGAAASPAPLRIRSVVTGLTDNDVTADPRIRIVERRGLDVIIETDRYRTFTEVLQGIAARGRDLREIAGNKHILITAFAPLEMTVVPDGTTLLFNVAVAARPQHQRLALDVKVRDLARLLRDAPKLGLELEHVYDY